MSGWSLASWATSAMPVRVRGAPTTVLLVALLFMTAITRGESIDRVLAVVNQGVITESELQHEVDRARLEFRSSNQKVPSRADLRPNLLESMIRDRIQLPWKS